jgi:error-prone DNA polymerase
MLNVRASSFCRWTCAIRLGLSSIHGFGPEQIQLLEQERWRGPYKSLTDLVKRTGLDRQHIEALVLAGALDYMGERRQLLWDSAEAYRLARRPKELPMKSKDERVKLPPMDARTRLATSFAFTGVSLEGHLTATRWDAFTRAGAQSIRELPRLKHGQKVDRRPDRLLGRIPLRAVHAVPARVQAAAAQDVVDHATE